MKPKNRNLRLIAISQIFHRANLRSMDSSLSMAQQVAIVDEMFGDLNSILEEEYEQGYEDGAEYTISLIPETVARVKNALRQ